MPWRGTALSVWTASIGSLSMWGAVRNRFPLGENTSNSTTIVGWKMDHERLVEVLGYIIYVTSENWGILKATLVDENVLVPLKECNGRVMKGLKPFQYRTATLVISRDPNLNLYFRLLLRVNHVRGRLIYTCHCYAGVLKKKNPCKSKSKLLWQGDHNSSALLIWTCKKHLDDLWKIYETSEWFVENPCNIWMICDT